MELHRETDGGEAYQVRIVITYDLTILLIYIEMQPLCQLFNLRVH